MYHFDRKATGSWEIAMLEREKRRRALVEEILEGYQSLTLERISFAESYVQAHPKHGWRRNPQLAEDGGVGGFGHFAGAL